MAITVRLDRFQRRHGWAGLPLAVGYKYFDDFGAYLAALLTYYGFVSLFPLLLLLSTVLGFVLSGDPRLQHEVLTSALHQFPLIGGDLARPKHLGGGTIGLVVGILGCLYGGLGVAQAFQYATNTVWGVPRNNRPNPFHARGRSLVLLATAGLALMGTTVPVHPGRWRGRRGRRGQQGHSAGRVRRHRHRRVRFRIPVRGGAAPVRARRGAGRDRRRGDLAGSATGRSLLRPACGQARHRTDAVFAIVLGLVAFLYVNATAVLLCMEINVVRVSRMHPRSLLTPFTDNVILTPGDRRAYTRQAKAQRSKGFQHVDVSFDPPPPGPVPDDPAT